MKKLISHDSDCHYNSSTIGPTVVNTIRSQVHSPEDWLRNSVVKDFKAVSDRESFVRQMSSSVSYRDCRRSIDWPSPVSSLGSPPTLPKEAISVPCTGLPPLPLDVNRGDNDAHCVNSPCEKNDNEEDQEINFLGETSIQLHGNTTNLIKESLSDGGTINGPIETQALSSAASGAAGLNEERNAVIVDKECEQFSLIFRRQNYSKDSIDSLDFDIPKSTVVLDSQEASGGALNTLGYHSGTSGRAFESALIRTDSARRILRKMRRNSMQHSLNSNLDKGSNDAISNTSSSMVSTNDGRSIELDSQGRTGSYEQDAIPKQCSLQLSDKSPPDLACDEGVNTLKSKLVVFHEATKLPNELPEEKGKGLFSVTKRFSSSSHSRASFQSRTSSLRSSVESRARGNFSTVSSLASYASPTFNFLNLEASRRSSMPVQKDRRNFDFVAAKRSMSERLTRNGSDSTLSSLDSFASPTYCTTKKKIGDAKNIDLVEDEILELADDKGMEEGPKSILSRAGASNRNKSPRRNERDLIQPRSLSAESKRTSDSSMSFDELYSVNSNRRDFFQSSGLGEGVALLLEHSTNSVSIDFNSDGIDYIDPNATGDGRDDFEYAMIAYLDAIKFGHFEELDADMTLGVNNNDQVLAARAYMGLGFARHCKGELGSSLDAYMKSLDLWEDDSGPSYHVASVSYTIGALLIEMQRLYDSSDYFSKAFRLYKCTQTPGPGNRADILSTEGMLFRVLGEFDRAIDCFRKSIFFYQAASQLSTLKFATVMFELGSLLSHRGEYSDSATFFNFALEIRKAHLGDSFLVARTHYSLGVTIAAQELKENTTFSSSSHLEEALRICQQEFTSEHVQSALIVHALGVLNERKGDSLSASAWFAKEHTIRKQLFGEGKIFVPFFILCHYTDSFCMLLHSFLHLQDHESLAPVCVDIGTCYYNSGKYDLAISFFEEALRIILRVGNEVDAEILYKIASCHDSLCNYDQALEKFYEVKRIHVSRFGVESTPVMQTMLRIGNILLCKGESKKSLECFNEVLGIGYASDSVNAIEVANALYGKGCAHFCDLHLTDAMKSFNESLNWKLAALGENSPGLACIFYQMAHVFLEQSNNEEAITCFEEYKRLQKLEPQRNLHDNAEICYTEGIVAKLKGRQDAALSFFHQALAMFETLFGADHEKVASIHFDIGCILSAMCNYEEGLIHFQTCLLLRRKLLGSHVDVANTLYEMASVYSRQARTELAVKCMIESDSIWKTKLRNNEKLTSLLLLSAKLWKSLKCYQPAEENLEQALHQAISIYGQQHEVIASTLLSLGELLQEINQIQQAVFCFDESIQVRTALYGPDSPSVAQVEYIKGVALLFYGDFKEALNCLNRALTIRQEKLGAMDGSVGDTLNTIGFLHLQMGNIWNDDALDPLTKSLEIRRAVGNSCKVVSTLQNIASVYKKRKQLDSWIDTHVEILNVRREELGLDDEKVADACISLGKNQMSVGRLDEATVSFEEALRIRTLNNGYNHKSVAQVLFRLGLLSSRQNKFIDAKQLFEEYMRIRAEEEDDPDEEMAQALTLMGDLQKETGEKSKAQINWTSALEIYANLGYPNNHPKVSKLRARQKAGGSIFGLPILRRPSDFSVKNGKSS
ncbi:hypothetical protein ACHAXA_003199 [Cyclostephanos tholiformis]|uniref:Uncharacterized protein n=1 Tax=Cyclostephanos tholiformis TaxID=382380 RepID=A0ABD3RYJ4_9STRA